MVVLLVVVLSFFLDDLDSFLPSWVMLYILFPYVLASSRINVGRSQDHSLRVDTLEGLSRRQQALFCEE